MRVALRTFTPSPKYGNRKVTIGTETFDSQAEARRWHELTLLRRAGLIRDLRRQVSFELVPAVPRDGDTPAQRALHYIADFVYVDEDGQSVVEDVKGFRTDVYRIKARLMLWRHGIKIKEVK